MPVQLVSRTVNSAPFVNPALKTVMNRPGFIPPTQTQLTTNVKVRGWDGVLRARFGIVSMCVSDYHH